MTYEQDGDQTTLRMTQNDYDQLLLILGFAVDADHHSHREALRQSWVRFINRMNTGNPRWLPYETQDENSE